MGNHLVLVGGGHAHLTVLLHLSDYVQGGHRVTLVGPSPYHYYSGMGPGMLSGIYPPPKRSASM
jgi:NADH dehydrogenase FAD-containing subunit